MNKKSLMKYKRLLFSMKAKVAILCTFSILIAVTVNFLFMFNASKSSIQSNTEGTLQDLANSYSESITEAVRQVSDSTNYLMSSSALTSFVSSEGKENQSEVEDTVNMFLSMNTSNEDVSIVDADGIVLYSSNSSLIGKDLSSETYFSTMVSSGLSSQSNVITSSGSGEACITFAIPLRDYSQFGAAPADGTSADTSSDSAAGSDTQNEGSSAMSSAGMPGRNMQEVAVTEFTGAIVTTVKVSAFSSILSDFKIASYKTGYAFILDPAGNVVYHPDEEIIGTKLDITEINDIVSQINDGTSASSGITTYSYNGVTKYASYSINSNNHWILFITAEQSEVLDSLNVVAAKTLSISVFLIIILSLIAYFVTGRITKSIQKITTRINRTAELDFREDQSLSSLSGRSDEAGEMSRAIDKMREVLKDMILHISEVSGKITESSNSLNKVSLAVNDHASDNSATAEELSASMQETAATTEHMNAAIENISISSGDIADKVSLSAQMSVELINKAMELKAATSTATDKTKKIYEEIKLKTNEAIEQSKAVEKINILTGTIKEIANQTTLLALNASIEAARAGEAGAGFSVVASEIGKLANESANAVSGISQIVDEVYKAVDNMTKNLEQALKFLGTKVLSDYNTFLDDSEKYNSDAGVLNEAMLSIQKQIDMLNANVQGISDSLSEINMMVGEAATGVSDVAEKNTNIVALTNNTQSMAEENTRYADSLKEIVEQFKL